MTVEKLLGEVTMAIFVNQYFLKLPFAHPDGCLDYARQSNSSAATAARVLTQSGADASISLNGARVDASTPTTLQEVRELLERGYSPGVQHAKAWDADRVVEVAGGYRIPRTSN